MSCSGHKIYITSLSDNSLRVNSDEFRLEMNLTIRFHFECSVAASVAQLRA
jgi:hypothetical protein